jgi:hypothetical protein
MTIIFNCPNGHKLNCPEQQAGKPGKCPRCGAVFQVPAAGGAVGQVAEMAPAAAQVYSIAETHTATEHSDGQGTKVRAQPAGAAAAGPQATAGAQTTTAVKTPGVQAMAAAQTAAGAQTAAAAQAGGPGPGDFMFLCPNGHRLHGSTGLVGKPGQCPQCSARFVVPSPDDIPDEETSHDLEQSQIQFATAPKLPASSLSVLNPGKSPGQPGEQHPMAVLFAQLWAQRTQGVSVELHLGDGKLLIPDQYSPQRSHSDYGLFAMREANGSLTLTAVAWDSISRVAVRGLGQLPKELFETRG